jgi:hypothetical protein
MKTRFLTLFFCAFLRCSAFAGLTTAVEIDLKDQWLVYENGKFIRYAERQTSPEVIYIRLKTRPLKGQHLKVSGLRVFNLFLNNRVVGSGKKMVLSTDSLSGAFSSNNLLVAIHQPHSGHNDLSTSLLRPASGEGRITDGLVKREGYYFRDFAVITVLLLMAFAVVIVRLNPKLASDYFSVRGIFSTREIQDSQVYTRIGSSTNILFYAYCSMLLAFYLIVTFHFTREEFPVANNFTGGKFLPVVLQWLKLSAILLVVFFLKIILVFGLSYLFGIPEIAGIHFFNWVRLLLIFFGLLTIILFIYFIWHGQSVAFHATMLKLLGWIVGGWIILIFLKLSGNASASMFHLFSYICATELIPFLFIIRVLYK